MTLPRLTLFGRSLLLVIAEILANAVCWIVAGVLFGTNPETRSILSLALLAWVCGRSISCILPHEFKPRHWDYAMVRTY